MKIKDFLIIIVLFLIFFSCTNKKSPTGPDNTDPIIAKIDNQTVKAGQTGEVAIAASDADGNKLSFTIPQNPGFLAINNVSQSGDTATATLVMAPDENIKGLFDGTVKVSDGKGGTDTTNFIIEVTEPTTKLFLRTNDTEYLSEEQTPPYTTVEFYFYSNTVNEWKAILGKGIEGNSYTFSLWLAANYPQGTFHVSLLVSHNNVETELASSDITVPSDQYYQRFSTTVEGQSGGSAGDVLILRITFSGSSRGGLLFGYSQNSDSHIIIPGVIPVSYPLLAKQLYSDNRSKISNAKYDGGKKRYVYSENIK